MMQVEIIQVANGWMVIPLRGDRYGTVASASAVTYVFNDFGEMVGHLREESKKEASK
jgi:hypothetical protein